MYTNERFTAIINSQRATGKYFNIHDSKPILTVYFSITLFKYRSKIFFLFMYTEFLGDWFLSKNAQNITLQTDRHLGNFETKLSYDNFSLVGKIAWPIRMPIRYFFFTREKRVHASPTVKHDFYFTRLSRINLYRRIQIKTMKSIKKICKTPAQMKPTCMSNIIQ